jgi:hypothetical protein
MAGWYPEWTWDRPSATIRDGRPPDRTYDEKNADPDWKPRPAGFTAQLRPAVEPLLWDGD